LHDASIGLDLEATTWSTEMAYPLAGEVMCHNDVCLENVVFDNGEAVALLVGHRVHAGSEGGIEVLGCPCAGVDSQLHGHPALHEEQWLAVCGVPGFVEHRRHHHEAEPAPQPPSRDSGLL
jgi:hypothetical protein